MHLLEQERNHLQDTHIEVQRPSPLQLAKTPLAKQKQQQQMVIALALLLITLSWLLYKDRDFWFPGAPVAETYPVDNPREAKTATPAA